MKKILVFAIIISALVCGVSCEKVEKGTYVADVTFVGMLNAELLPNGRCLLYFTGGSEEIGSYDVEGDKITISAIVHTPKDKHGFYDYFVFEYDEPGKIYDKDSFGIWAKMNGKRYYCSFHKRY